MAETIEVAAVLFAINTSTLSKRCHASNAYQYGMCLFVVGAAWETKAQMSQHVASIGVDLYTSIHSAACPLKFIDSK